MLLSPGDGVPLTGLPGGRRHAGMPWFATGATGIVTQGVERR
jgi:hypothetical protein